MTTITKHYFFSATEIKIQQRTNQLLSTIIAHFCNDVDLPTGDPLPFNSSPRSSHTWFSYIHNFIIILSRVYNEPIQRPAPSWLVSPILVEHHTVIAEVKGLNPTSLNFFRLSFRNCKSGDEFLSYNSSPRSSHIWFSYIDNWTDDYWLIP